MNFTKTFASLLLSGSLFAMPAAEPTAVPVDEDEFAGVACEDLTVGEDAHQRYFLIGSEGAPAPKAGFKLLLVLPGGDGGADFNAFVKRIHKRVLGADYLVAQLVAPVWSSDQAESMVWPVTKNPWKRMRFSTEQFIDAVIDDVEASRGLDPAHVYVLGWSSGGPPAYAYAVTKKSRATGVFVAMSVFKPEHMESLKRAKGMAYYILHSPGDFISMDFPKTAVARLSKKKAKVELATYEGGHGWHGDVWGNMRAALDYLEQNHADPARRRR